MEETQDFNYPVYYLEEKDFDENGNITNSNIPTNKPVFIMMQANWCPHCRHAKSDYQLFADRNENVAFVTSIQVDGKQPGEKNNKKIVRNIYPDFQGYPSYIVYYNGKRIPFENGRKTQDLEAFLDNVLAGNF
jgi:thiol-disulfide isomerase/thioredoxin